MFPLVPEGGEEEGDKPVIQLHVPQGAVRAAGEGMIEVRYAVIANGPFRTPEGYSLCSMAVYIHYNPAWTTKPFRLLLPHWSGAPNHPTFVTSPHTLPEGEQHYPFRLLEGGEFREGYGIVEVDGHCTLIGQAYQLKDTSRYYAFLLEREEGNSCHSRVAITFADVVWIQVYNCLYIETAVPHCCTHLVFVCSLLYHHVELVDLDPELLLEEVEEVLQRTLLVC